jgi:hypothetical protein
VNFSGTSGWMPSEPIEDIAMKLKIQVNYKSGVSMSFWVREFSWTKSADPEGGLSTVKWQSADPEGGLSTVKWQVVSAAETRPSYINVDRIESVWVLETKYSLWDRILKALSLFE